MSLCCLRNTKRFTLRLFKDFKVIVSVIRLTACVARKEGEISMCHNSTLKVL